MTDNEIIKTLECLKGYALKCRECPYLPRYAFPHCQQKVAKDALDLINRLKSELFEKTEQLETAKEENENLKDILYDNEGVNLVNYWHQQCKIAENGCKNFEEENKRLQAENERLRKGWKADVILTANTKAESYKEFAERLKTKKHECGCNCRKKPVYAVTEEKIDETYKELVGEDK